MSTRIEKDSEPLSNVLAIKDPNSIALSGVVHVGEMHLFNDERPFKDKNEEENKKDDSILDFSSDKALEDWLDENKKRPDQGLAKKLYESIVDNGNNPWQFDGGEKSPELFRSMRKNIKKTWRDWSESKIKKATSKLFSTNSKKWEKTKVTDIPRLARSFLLSEYVSTHEEMKKWYRDVIDEYSRSKKIDISGDVSESEDNEVESEFESEPEVDKADGKYRCYTARLTSSSTVQRLNSVTNNVIVYRIGARKNNSKESLVDKHKGSRLHQRFQYSDSLSSELQGLNRKYTNFSGNYVYGDLSGVLYRLAQGFAVYSAFGRLRFNDLIGGQINVRSLGTMDEPVNSVNNCVFVPRHVNVTCKSSIFAALVAAINWTGSLVVTDIVSVDENNVPILKVCDDALLAEGCWLAIRVILSMLDVSVQGSIGAFAVVKGMHSILSVVGHTDEGAFMRGVLRKNSFVPSYGGIYSSMAENYVGVPLPALGQLTSIIAIVDGILLTSAGMCARSDPCQELKGRMYPTVIQSRHGDICNGFNDDADLGDSLDISRKIALICSSFSDVYAANLGKLFLLHGGEEVVSKYLQENFNAMTYGYSDRHLQHKIVAPYYWIEPTSLFKNYDDSYIAERHGYGIVVGTKDDSRDIMAFEDMDVMDQSNMYYMDCTFRSARTSGMIIHHQLNSQNGLGAVRLWQGGLDDFCLRGGIDESIATSVQENRNLDEYLWRRGDAGVPAPAELLYTNEKIKLMCVTNTVDEDFNYVSTNVKYCEELKQPYNFVVGIPYCVGLLALGERPREVKRCRTQAGTALTQVATSIKTSIKSGGENIPKGNFVPIKTFVKDELKGIIHQDLDNRITSKEDFNKKGVANKQFMVEQALKIPSTKSGIQRSVGGNVPPAGPAPSSGGGGQAGGSGPGASGGGINPNEGGEGPSDSGPNPPSE